MLKGSETLCFFGTVSLTVLQGSIILSGTRLNPSSTSHPVFAPTNYPIATIKVLQQSRNQPFGKISLPDFLMDKAHSNDVIIRIQDLGSGIRKLGRVCGLDPSLFERQAESIDFGLQEFFPVNDPFWLYWTSNEFFLLDLDCNTGYYSLWFPFLVGSLSRYGLWHSRYRIRLPKLSN